MLHDRDYMRGRQSSNWLPWIWSDAVAALVTINVVVYVVQLLFNNGVPFSWGVLSIPALAEGKVWTLLTHFFIHRGLLDVIFSSLFIFFAGKALQSLLGMRNLLYVYFLAGLGGSVLELAVGWVAKQPAVLIGTSGCTMGLLLGLAVMLPQERVGLFPLPVRVKIWNLAIGIMGVALVLAILQVFRVMNLGFHPLSLLGGGLTGWWFVRTLGYGGGPITYERLWMERQQREQTRELAGVRRKPREVSSSSSRKQTGGAEVARVPERRNTKEFIAREIDPILDKITAHGITSLTEEERKLLQRARHEIITRDGN